MGFLLLLSAFAFILIYWVTAWLFFKILATICAALAVVVIAGGWIIGIFKNGRE